MLLPLHLGIMTVAGRVHDGPLALPAPPPPRQVNGSGARLHNVHPALLSTGAVSTPTPDIPIEGRGNKRVATMTAVLLLMHLVLMMVSRRVHNGPLALPAPTPTGPANGNVATQVMITMIKRLVEVTMTSSPKITNTSGTSTIDHTEFS